MAVKQCFTDIHNFTSDEGGAVSQIVIPVSSGIQGKQPHVQIGQFKDNNISMFQRKKKHDCCKVYLVPYTASSWPTWQGMAGEQEQNSDAEVISESMC